MQSSHRRMAARQKADIFAVPLSLEKTIKPLADDNKELGQLRLVSKAFKQAVSQVAVAATLTHLLQVQHISKVMPNLVSLEVRNVHSPDPEFEDVPHLTYLSLKASSAKPRRVTDFPEPVVLHHVPLGLKKLEVHNMELEAKTLDSITPSLTHLTYLQHRHFHDDTPWRWLPTLHELEASHLLSSLLCMHFQGHKTLLFQEMLQVSYCQISYCQISCMCYSCLLDKTTCYLQELDLRVGMPPVGPFAYEIGRSLERQVFPEKYFFPKSIYRKSGIR